MAMNEIDRILQNPEHVIMSDDLTTLLGENVAVKETLKIDGTTYFCALRRAKLLDGVTRHWEIVAVVPGLDLGNFIDVEEIIFSYDAYNFNISTSSLEFEKEGVENTVILTGTRIIKKDE